MEISLKLGDSLLESSEESKDHIINGEYKMWNNILRVAEPSINLHVTKQVVEGVSI